jgi:hypothetical protein
VLGASKNPGQFSLAGVPFGAFLKLIGLKQSKSAVPIALLEKHRQGKTSYGFLRAAHRQMLQQASAAEHVGFRVVCEYRPPQIRFGLLYLRKGEWNGKQLLSAKLAVMAVTSPLPNTIPRTQGKKADMIAGQRSIGGGNNQTDHFGSYSFAWWTNGVDRDGKRHWPAAPHDTYGALGHGGMRATMVIPSLDIVVSWNDAKINSRSMENRALKMLVKAVGSRRKQQVD